MRTVSHTVFHRCRVSYENNQGTTNIPAVSESVQAQFKVFEKQLITSVIFQAEMSSFSILNVKICCFSLLSMIVNEESLFLWTAGWNKKDISISNLAAFSLFRIFFN